MTFSDLKKRPIFKVGVAYLSVSWLIVQIIGTLTPIMNYPGILVRGFAFMLIMGYPLFMMMAWVFEITHNTKGWEAIDEENRKNAVSGKVFYGVITGILVLTISIMLLDIFYLDY